MKVSAVGFLNSAPLTWGLSEGRAPEGWDVAFDVPSRCAERLLKGEADLGLVPSVVFLREPWLTLAAPLGVVAPAESGSVLLVLGGELASIRRVLLDPASRTSQALARLLLQEALPGNVSFEEGIAPERLGPTEAALVIGDRALRLPGALGRLPALDLASLWKARTGLPFVFAVWAGRREVCTAEVREVLASSCALGLACLDDIVDRHAVALDLPPARIRHYLTRQLAFAVGREERAALARFSREVLGEEPPPSKWGEPHGHA
ncbi:MAG: menaquinone biosynthesis protein [Acidobacteriota bacterium]